MKAKKSLGQNFLKSPAVIRKMVEVAEVSRVDTILEIGPGKGALTHYLIESGAQVVAIEKDADMIPILEERFAEQIEAGQLALICGDISNKDLVATCPLTDKYKLVANIPYYITGEIIRTFLETKTPMVQPMSITIMVQKEVAQRIVARDSKESILSMSVKAYSTPKYIQKVPAMLFNPKPKVDSAILHISGISKDFFKENNITEKQFFTVIKAGFAQKRKKLTNNLSIRGEILEHIGVESKARAETLTLKQWGQLTKVINADV